MASPSAVSSASTPSACQQSSNNQQHSAIDLNSKNSAPSMQQQQHELIKLLAEHFQHQFYQTFTVGRADQQQRPHQTYQQSQFVAGASAAFTGSDQPPMLISRPGAFDLGLLAGANQNGLNNLPGNTNLAAINANQLLHNRLLLQSPADYANTGPNSSSSSYHQQVASEPSPANLLNFATQQAYPSNPPSVDLLVNQEASLLNALGLNLTSNQLAAIQQQHQQHSVLFQAAKQFGSTEMIDTDRHRQDRMLQPRGSQQQPRSRPKSRQEPQGSEMLNFSINTILGRSSPEALQADAANLTQNRPVGKSIDHLNKLFGHSNSNCLLESNPKQQDNEDPRDPGSPGSLDIRTGHCDEESSRESSSSQNSAYPTTQINQETSAINLYNQLQAVAHSTPTATNHDQSHLTTAGEKLNVNMRTHPVPAGLTNQRQHHHMGAHHGHPHLTPFLTGSAAFPWTVAVRGKPRRGMMRRAVFSDSQRVGLEKRFQSQKYISKPDRKKLAEKLGLRDSQVKIWFQNRRMKWRNSKERELLSAGGSREQTLPTRNNPNPDLSDVGETIKRLQTTTPVAPTLTQQEQQQPPPLKTSDVAK